MTWLDAIKEALEELGGKGSLEDIYKKVQEIGHKKLSIEKCDTWRDTIRQTIYDHSSDSESFRSGVDIFCHLGHGIWGLRDMLSTTQTHKHFGNELVESQQKEAENMGEQNIFDKRPHLIPAIIAATMLLGALARWPYGYYQLLRLVVCGVSIYIAVMAYQWQKMWAMWVFGFIAVLFNPLIPIHLSLEIWQPIDIVCAALFIVIAFVLKKADEGKKQED